MTKAKEATKDKEIIVAEEVETGLANPTDVMSFLNKKADEIYSPGFAEIKINHQGGTFSAEGFGTSDEISGIILAMEETRALWAFGTEKERAEIDKWKGSLPLCSSRGDNAANHVGEIPKPLDNDAPDLVRTILKPILDVNCKCGTDNNPKCEWARFGSSTGGRGQACKKCVRLLLWNPGSQVAGVLIVSPTSLKAWRNYRAGIPEGHFSSVITTFMLNVQQSGSNTWSMLRFKQQEPVSMEMIQPLGRAVKYQGRDVMEAEALLSEFLALDLSEDELYDTNGSAPVDVTADDF